MKVFGTAIMALALLWGLSGCVVTPNYPTHGAYPYDYPSCTAYNCSGYYGGPAYYVPGGWYPYYGTVILGGYYRPTDRHHHHYSYPLRAPHSEKYRPAPIGHHRHSDGWVDRSLPSAFHRPDRAPARGDRHLVTDRGHPRRPSADLDWREHRKAIGDVFSRERRGEGGDFRWRGDGKLLCSGSRC